MKENVPMLGTDLLLTPFFTATEWDTLDLSSDPALSVAGVREEVDLAATKGYDTLRQAIILRLLTPLGCLADLGHSGYGSRLNELVGELNTASTRMKAKVYVLQALAQEQRIGKVVGLLIMDPAQTGRRDILRIEVNVLPLDSEDPLKIGLEVSL